MLFIHMLFKDTHHIIYSLREESLKKKTKLKRRRTKDDDGRRRGEKR